MKWYSNMKMSLKLILAFSVMGCVLAFVGVYGIVNVNKVSDMLDDMYNARLIPVKESGELQVYNQRLRVNIINMLIATSEEQKNQFLGDITTIQQEVEALLRGYDDNFTEQEQFDLYNNVIDTYTTFLEVYDKTLESTMDGMNDYTVELLLGEYQTVRLAFHNALEELNAYNLQEAEKAMDSGAKLAASLTLNAILIVVGAFLLSVGLGIIIARNISRKLNHVVHLVGNVAKGDLSQTVEIDSKDEVGILAKSVNEMIISVRGTVSGVLSSAESLSAASQEISASTEEIASGSLSQASEAQSMNELFKDLTDAIQSVAKDAEHASELSSKALVIAGDGGKVLQDAVAGMNEISIQIDRLADDSNKIGEIIELIDDIADQTNLLALNAAIEAARAGEQGRGFAVVADEVRKLAERSSDATKQITTIIKQMQENMKHSVKAVEVGVQLTSKTGESFDHIVDVVTDTAQNVAGIAAAGEEQSAQAADVLISLDSISAATQEAAASNEETAAAAQSLAHLAEELNSSVSIFKVK